MMADDKKDRQNRHRQYLFRNSQVLFASRCKLFRYDNAKKENKERGIGEIKVCFPFHFYFQIKFIIRLTIVLALQNSIKHSMNSNIFISNLFHRSSNYAYLFHERLKYYFLFIKNNTNEYIIYVKNISINFHYKLFYFLFFSITHYLSRYLDTSKQKQQSLPPLHNAP